MRPRPFLRSVILLPAIAFLWIGAQATSVSAQARTYPAQGYYLGFAPFAEGDYVTAAQAFQAASRSGLRTVDGRWIDSICYHTMMGECAFRMGDNAQALTHYTTALQLYLANAGWMTRIDFPQVIGPMQRQVRPPISWGVSRRNPNPGQFPKRILFIQQGLGVRTADAVVLGQAESVPVDAVEIARCTALAMYRRMEIMGPLAASDELTGRLLTTLSRRPAPPNHWSQAWVDVMLGIANASAGKPAQAVSDLNRSLKLGGQYDHPLTGLALLTLGRVAFMQGKHNEAIGLFYEATFPAASYDQFHVIGDAMSSAALAHMVSGQRGVYPPLSPVAAWARTNSRALQGWMQVAAAGNLAHGGNSNQAAGLIEQAKSTLRRAEMINGTAGAKLSYLSALTNFQRGNVAAGQRAFQSAMTFQRKSSLRLFQTDLADRMYASNQISDRIASELYSLYLSDPNAAQWSLDPMETLTGVLAPHSLAMEHWFEVALLRKESQKALEIADLIRRRRFYSSLPMGGRLLSLRWVLEGPEETLSEQALRQRRDILARYPAYAELSRRAADVQRELSGRPLVSTDETLQDETNGLLAALADASAKRELLLQAVALRRDAADFAFPPALDFKRLQADMPESQLTLAYFSTNRYVYAFLLDKQNLKIWRVGSPDKVQAEMKALFKQLGLHDKNQPVQLKELRDESWKETAAGLSELLLAEDIREDLFDRYDELVVVPDGSLWYLPFELLQFDGADGRVALREKVRVRYAPTASLTAPDRRRLPPSARTAIVAGKMLPRDEDFTVTEALEDYQAVLPGSIAIPKRPDTPASLLASQVEQLVVATDIDDSDRAPYGWAPMPVDAKVGATLADWMTLPFGAPQHVAVPGFHTAAENGLRRGGAGNEVFFTVCGMMSAGSRTVLLSRWRVGGASTRNLTREFVQELPHQSASRAWDRSVRLHLSRPLDPTQEPRVQGAKLGEALPSQHPFFWAGYLVVDTGSDPTVEPPPRPAAARAPARPGAAKPDAAKPDAAKPDAAKPDAVGAGAVDGALGGRR